MKYRFSAGIYLFFVYAFGVFSKTAWSDDYSEILDPGGVALHAIRDGRLVYGWAIDLLFGLFNTVQSLVFIRLIGLIGLILLNDLLIRNLLKEKFSIGVVVASCVAFTLPSFQFTSHWAGAFGFSWTAYFAVLGYHLLNGPSNLKRLSGLILFVVSLLAYPLMSFFIFPYIYVLWFVRELPFKALVRDLRVAISLLIGGTVISFVISNIYMHLNGLDFSARVALVTFREIPSTLVFFLTRPFALTYRPFFIDSPTTLNMLLTLFFFFAGITALLWLKFKSLGAVTRHLIVLNLFFVFSLLPLLVTSQNQIDMRFVGSNTWLYCFVVVFLLLNTQYRSREVPNLASNRLQVFIIILSLTIGFYTINRNFHLLFQVPYQTKAMFFEKQIASCTSSQIESGIVITRRTLPWPHKNLIGAYSQSTDLESDWVPAGAVVQFLKDSNRVSNSLPVLGAPGENTSACEINLDEY